MDVDAQPAAASEGCKEPNAATVIPVRFRRLQEMWEDEDGLMDAVDAVLAEAVDQLAPSHSGGAKASSHSGEASAGGDGVPNSKMENEADLSYGNIEDLTPRLKSIVDGIQASLPQADHDRFRRLLSSLDLCSIVHCHGYDSGVDFQGEGEAFCNSRHLRISNSIRTALLRTWEAANQACLRNVKTKIDAAEVLVVKQPQTPGEVVSIRPPLPQPPPVNPRYKNLKPIKELPGVEVADQAKAAVVEAKWNASHLQSVDQLWDIMMKAGNDSSKAREIQNVPQVMQSKLKDMFRHEYKVIPEATIRSKLGTIRRLHEWCQEAGFRKWALEKWQVRMFLYDQHEKGSTVAKSQLNNLKWIQSRLGINFFAEDDEVAAVTVSGVIIELRQAVPLTVRLWVTFEAATSSNNVLVQVLAASWIILLLTSVRFAHFQRSRLLAKTEHYLVALASLGKSRKGGARRPFKWICPFITISGKVDFISAFIGVLQLQIGPEKEEGQPPWLLPDFGPKRSTLATAKTLVASPMGIGRFHELSNQLLASMQIDEKVTSYRARRLLPSIADYLEYPSADRSRLGGWVSSEVQQAARDIAMPNRYSHHALEVEGTLRAKLAIQVKRALFGLPKQAVKDLGWPELLNRAPTRAEASEFVAKWRGENSLKPDILPEVGPKFLTAHDSSSETSSGSSDSSSSSDSDFSGDDCFMCPKCFRKFTLQIARDSHSEFCGVRLPTKTDSQSGTVQASAQKITTTNVSTTTN